MEEKSVVKNSPPLAGGDEEEGGKYFTLPLIPTVRLSSRRSPLPCLPAGRGEGGGS
jgi:hypothetical protein